MAFPTAAEIALQQQAIEQLKQLVELRKQQNAAYDDVLEKIKEAQSILEAQTTLEALQKQQVILAAMAEGAQKRLELSQHAIDVAKAELALAVALGEADEDRLKALQKNVEELEKARDTIRDSDEAAKDLGKSLAGAFQMSGVRDYTSGLGKMGKALAGGTASAGEFVKEFGTNVMNSMVNNVIHMAVSLVNAEAAFRKATGGSIEFAQGVTKTFEATRAYGVTAEEASSANMTLYRTFTDFTMATEGTRMALTKTAGVLAELGVTNQDFAASTQAATKMMGVSADRMPKVAREITTFAQEMNMDVGQMFSAFAQAGGELAKFGSDGVDTFKRLQHASKITGLEMNKLLQITNRFDTFEAAAKQAGMLNAALGGNMVNAMDLMMTTDPVGRFEMLRDAILDTGLTFDDMSYFQKNFYKDALGLQEVGDLALMLSGNMDTLAGATQKTAKDYEELAEQAKVVQSLQDQFNAALAAATPVLIPLMEVIKGFFNIISANEVVLKTFVYGMLLAKVAMMPFSGAATLGLVSAPALGVAIGTLGTVSAAAALPLLGLGAAMMLIGGGIALASSGVADTFKAIASIGDFRQAASAVSEIRAEIEKIPEEKAISLAVAMESIATVSEAVKTAADRENIRGAVAAGTEAATAGRGARGTGVTQVNQPIILQVGDNEMADFVIEAMGAEFIKFKLSQS